MSTRSKPNAVVFDLDSTLCDCTHRHHLVACSKPDFLAFHQKCYDDGVVHQVKFALDCYIQKGYKVIILTGRPVRYIEPTINWLMDNMVEYDQLIMKRDSDPQGDVEYKKFALRKLVIDNYNVVAVFEDRKKIVDMLRNELGLFVFDVSGNSY